MFDNTESIITFAVAVLIAYGVILSLGILVWVYRDVRARTQDGWAQAASLLLVLLFNIPGLFLYLILRPHETLAESHERRLEAEALMHDLPEPALSCPGCDRRMRDEFLLCPHCRTKLRQACAGCAQALDLSWTACPHCGAPGPQAVIAKEQPAPARPAPAPPAQPPVSQADASQADAQPPASGTTAPSAQPPARPEEQPKASVPGRPSS